MSYFVQNAVIVCVLVAWIIAVYGYGYGFWLALNKVLKNMSIKNALKNMGSNKAINNQYNNATNIAIKQTGGGGNPYQSNHY